MKITYYHFPTIDSTNNFAKQNISQFDVSSLTVITAITQTAGRGRLGRQWVSSKGNVCLSLILFDDTMSPFYATQLASLAVDDVLHEYGIPSAIKWPNDLIVSGKKIGGILTEKSENALILGIGLNVSLGAKEISSIEQSATSIFLETGTLYSVEAIIQKIVAKFHNRLLLRSPNDPFIWLERVSWMIGNRYVLKRNKIQTGTISSITKDGELLFLHQNGEEELIVTGDIHV